MSAPVPGPPGIYLQPDLRSGPPDLLRLDACGFVGVAARGPAWERRDDSAFEPGTLPQGRARSVAVPVRSWAEFEEIFGGDIGPGLLARSVAAFFNAGGRIAYVVRVVPADPPPTRVSAGDPAAGAEPAPSVPGCALFSIDLPTGPLLLRARNEGRWGDGLGLTLRFNGRPLLVDLAASEGRRLRLDAGAQLVVGSLIRISGPTHDAPSLHQVVTRNTVRTRDGWRVVADLDPAPSPLPASAQVEVVTTELTITLSGRPAERFDGLSLSATHPAWLGGRLAAESLLLEVDPADSDPADLTWWPEPQLTTPPVRLLAPGADRYRQIGFDDVLGPEPLSWLNAGHVPSGDPVPPAGVSALAQLPDCAGVCVPDLYSPVETDPADSALEIADPQAVAGPEFARCVDLPPAGPPAMPPVAELPRLRLDPQDRDDLDTIIELQNRLVATAARIDLVTLLDVPPRLRPADVRRWRAGFDTSWAAAYHGWPRVAPPYGTQLRSVPPSAYAAAVVARRERDVGLAYGPAQQPLAGVLAVLDGPGTSAPGDRGLLRELHASGINVTTAERGMTVQTAARTLSLNPAFRQLTTRRLFIYLRRRLLADLAWATFEPNGLALRLQVRLCVEAMLDELYRLGAFAGRDRASSYFVRIAQPATQTREAEMLCEIGVAPSEPLEFILVRLLRTDDGALAAVPAESAATGAVR